MAETDNKSQGEQKLILSPVWLSGIFLLSFACIVIVTFSLAGDAGPNSRSQNLKTIATFEGNGNGETGFFTVNDSWEIKWEHQGNLQAIEWIGKNGGGSKYIAMHKKPIREHGRVNNGKGGIYKLNIVGEGPWKIEVNEFH